MKLAIALTLLVAACKSPAPTPTTPPAPTKGKAHRFQIGELEAYALSDGSLTLPNDGKTFGVGQSTDEIGDVLAAAGLPRDQISLDLQAMLVKSGERVILFDTGVREAWAPDAGLLLESFAAAGIAPGAVTDIFISHAHGDHVGLLITPGGALTFPAATIRMSAPEWAHLQADADDSSKRLVAAIAAQVEAFEPGAQVLPEVKAVDTRGHTPGHSSYEVGVGVDKLFYLGDLAHHSILSVQRPAWSIQFDTDRAAAEPMRQETLSTLAAGNVRVFAFHFPYPGLGRVAAEGDDLVWRPEAD